MYLDRIGPIVVNITYDDAERATGFPLVVSDDLDTGGECVSVELSGGPSGLSFMGSNGRIVRIQVYEGAIKTLSSIGIGSTEADVQRAYPGRITIEPHPYTDGHYLVFTPRDAADAHLRLIFETDGTQVTSFRTGLAEWVELIEGCA